MSDTEMTFIPTNLRDYSENFIENRHMNVHLYSDENGSNGTMMEFVGNILYSSICYF